MDKKLEARVARLEKLINEDNNRGADMYAEANKLFYQALEKYRNARTEAMNDGLDKKLFDRLTKLIDNFLEAGIKLVNGGAKFFDWTDWNARHSNK